MKQEDLMLILSELTTNTEKVEQNQAFLLKAFETYVEELRELEGKINTIEIKSPKVDTNGLSNAINEVLHKHITSNQALYKSSEKQLSKVIEKINKHNRIKEILVGLVLPWIMILPLSYFAAKFGHRVWIENLTYKTTVKYLKAGNPKSVEMIDSIIEQASTQEGRKEMRKDIRNVNDN